MRKLRILSTIVEWGWSPLLIAVLALLGYFYEWPIWLLAGAMGVILVIGLVAAVIKAREGDMERASLKLRQLSGYFNRRFMGNSSLSIFVIIDGLFNIDNPRLWDWARGCDMAQRVFNNWGNSFIDRMESDARTGRFSVYLRTYLNELWLLNTNYYEFVEQFHELALTIELPKETVDQFNRFVMEYNAFVQNLRDIITDLKKIARSEIEAPSVKLTQELPRMKPPVQTSEDREPESTQRQAQPGRGGGYYL
ncbi:MAG: hypothetical protein Q8Q07_08880 [Dehalococcoidales bacterium]|nr:hypothetical protein [Dehalococcoidales bacterium]MDZ4230679.1 hypothetical protein [Dehalococcoidales bacterium]